MTTTTDTIVACH